MRRNVRWLGIGLGFTAIVPAHAVSKLVGTRELIPPFFLKTMGSLAGLRVRTEGRARSGALLLANHLSWLDILALAHLGGDFLGNLHLVGVIHVVLDKIIDLGDAVGTHLIIHAGANSLVRSPRCLRSAPAAGRQPVQLTQSLSLARAVPADALP